MIIALITNKNKPNVSKVTGIVSNTRTGFKKVFNKPNTTATNKAPVKLVTCTPGKK
jgi:hypothetical protein